MKAKMFFLLTAFTMVSLFFAACGNEAGNTENKDGVAADSTATDATAPASNIRLTPFPSSTEFPNASLTFGYENGKFLFHPRNYQFKQQTPDAPQKMCANSKDGQHVHLIIDNEPYDAVYESSFAKDVPDGTHYILGFLSRSYHESIKTKDAYMAQTTVIKGNTTVNNPMIEEAMLFYSRPKGK
ncbi:MAG: hypothetical protein IPM82_07610 [Saprospiraceae bacterium]|nr:hypothetical protein [Saprospiraceae bacterium]